MPFGFGRKKTNLDPEPDPVDDEHAPGWDALDERLGQAFPGQDPHHWKPDDVLLPAQDGVWGISAYRERSAWFYITYGLTDLFDLFPLPDTSDRSPDGITWSGYGFELTMRVSPLDPTPPTWPVELLSELGKYVYQSGSGFEAGDRMNPRGEITGGRPKTRLTALAFARDPALDPLDTPLGRVEFIQVVGITADELDRMKASSTETVLEELRQGNPSLTTNPSR